MHRVTGGKASFGFEIRDNSLINNRQNGRRRGRGGNNGGGNNQRQGGNQGRGDSANRIDSRARGNANQLYEKYKNLARDAQMSGDRVNIEYYLQFADHYFRVLADQRSRTENDTQPRRQQPFDINGDDDDDMVEGEAIRAGEQNGEDRDDRGSFRQQNDRQQNDRQQNVRRDRGEGGDQQRYARGNDRGADQRPRRDRDDRNDRDEVAGQHRSDPPASDESLDARAEQVIEADAPLAAPRRRGRPRRDEATMSSGDAREASLPADLLPPSLGIAAANDADPDDQPKPRRRTRRPATEVPAAE